MTDLTLQIMISAVNTASSVLKSVVSDLGSLNPAMGIAAGAALAAGAAIVGIGVASVKAAGNFQQAMLSNVAHAGLAKDQIDAVSQAVLQMSTIVGRSPNR